MRTIGRHEQQRDRAPDRTAPAPLGHQPGLDGVRGIAIGLVLLAHWGRPDGHELLGGAPYIGVDVFFVLSGFLITRLLLDEAAVAGWIHLKGFWARRALRLLPLSTLVILGVGVIATAYPSAFYRAGADVSPARAVFAALCYHMNWLQASASTHHDWALTPTWSLSLEEQFYVLWPLIVSACVLGAAGAPHVIGRRVAAASALIVIGSLATRVWLMRRGAFDHVYNGLDSRAGQLCSGTLLAAVSVLRPAAVRALSRLAPLGLLGICVIAARVGVDRRFLGLGYDIVAGLSVVVIAGAVTVEGWTGRLLRDARLVWLGVRAYALYLVHYPLFYFMTRTHLPWIPEWTLRASRMILALCIADVLHRYVEKPLLGLRRHHPVFDQARPAREPQGAVRRCRA